MGLVSRLKISQISNYIRSYSFLLLLLNVPCFGLDGAKCYIIESMFLYIMRLFALTNQSLSLNMGTPSDMAQLL